MYIVKWKDKFGLSRETKCDTLAEAIDNNRLIDRPGTVIIGGGMEIVGSMGVDSIKDGLCPDGVEYTWKKRR